MDESVDIKLWGLQNHWGLGDAGSWPRCHSRQHHAI